MTSFNEERFDLKMQFQPTHKTEGASEYVRKKPTSKPKKDFEKVMKRKEDDSDDKTVLTRKAGVGEKKEEGHKKGLLENIEAMGVQQQSAYEGLASRQGYIPETVVTKLKDHPEFAQEQPDLSGIQQGPSQALQVLQNKTFDSSGKTEVDPQGIKVAIQKIEEIVDQIVNKIYTLRQEGKTETIMTLRHPPLFEGAELKVTEFKSARGEFNITFSNLRPDAKAIVDAHQAQNALQRALEQRGYVAHIVVVTTEKEEPIVANESSESQYGNAQRNRKEKDEREKEQG